MKLPPTLIGARVQQQTSFRDGALLLFEPPNVKDEMIVNLVRVHANGDTLWVAQPCRPYECYSAIKASENEIFAWTFSCYRVKIEPDNGQWSDMIFVK